ncbi:lytic transglycosylase domain-containing protein [Phreatobacter oligotrophus]|uniref:Soluble lytic murein transglycosylase n=1 Tax=Phreatobacter oligotrophus TaxID=1122261 RepID=A0A2T4ZIF4_9HYPH|nr:lytic transglycosylase domain-containing protein [Phreatobacter oligotrophus]PTM61770.1 soluble lytic murein transglycosylase [Phreatobacter oligotrophus]
MPVRVFGVVPPAPVAPLVPRLGFLAGVALSSLLVGGCAKSEASADQAGTVAVASAEAPETTGAISPAQQVWRPAGGTASEAEIGALRQVATAARANRVEQATAARDQIRDPVAKALAEWMILRSNDSVGFARLSGFLDAHPSFPASQRIRMRAEGSLLENNADAATVRQFFAHRQPTSAKGRVALAIALKRGGDQARAVRLIRETWHGYDLSSDVEDRVLAEFGGQISAGDHKMRLDRMLHEGENATAMRAAQRLGGGQPALARAFLAIGAQQANGGTLLAQVPASLHRDPAYLFARAQWLRREDRAGEAAQILVSAPRDPAVLGSADDWWTERRAMVRKLLDAGEARSAYQVAATHAVRSGPGRVDAEFHAGWVALRFLNDTATAMRHFEAARQAATTPMSQSRAQYWLGRAHDAAGSQAAARTHYAEAARHSTHYYGQLARAKLGLADLPIRRPADTTPSSGAYARALQMLYRIDEKDLARAILADLGQRAADQGTLHAAAEVAARAGDAKGVLTLGKLANNRGLPFDQQAFPTMGIPAYAHVGPEIDRAVVYAIARQESTFDPRVVSHAGARGLLQLMPATARATARNHGLPFDQGRLTSDPAYNARLGAAHLGELAAEFNGSYILTFVAYNAGRARAREWIQKYGDPRDPRVDPVDWVERIPFSETRNYVQRVMENVQVYRARLGGGSGLRIEADLRRGGG